MVSLRSSLRQLSNRLVPQSLRGGKSARISYEIVGQTKTGEEIIAFTMRAPSGLSATWLNYGAALQSLILPDGTNIVAGFEDPMRYLSEHPSIGVTIGPVANRIGGAQFMVGDQRYKTDANTGEHTLHSGQAGFQFKVWDHAIDGNALALFLDVPDGDGGFPGHREVALIIQLADNALRIEWSVETDADTPINLTLHSYFNMSGDFSTPIDHHALQTDATQYTQTDDAHIPTGQTLSVAGTKFDFTDPDEIGARVIDQNLLVPGEGLRELAALTDGVRTLFLNADTPGLQVYTGETLPEGGLISRAALALEPQNAPDAINTPVDGDDSLLHAGQTRYGIIEYVLHGPGLPR